MIVTVTPNPSLDRTIEISSLERGAVQRATSTRLDAGGKGLNVSRALVVNSSATLAVLPIGGGHGAMMADLLVATDTPVRTVPIAQSIRANVALVEPDGTTTKINELGPVLTEAEISAFLAVVSDAVPAGGWVVGCGSLPGGVEEDFYADLVRLAHSRGAKAAVDTSEAPLAASIAASPDLIKPNRVELGELVGADLQTVADVVSAARDLIDVGVGALLVSLGKDGALLVTAKDVTHASGVAERVSTVGAGDCTLAGYLHALDAGLGGPEALARAVAFGSAAVSLPGTQVPDPAQVAAVPVTVTPSPEMSTVLTD